jgi:hypothetical protein
MVFGHGNFSHYEIKSADTEDVDTKRTIFKKPFMPKRWKFFRTSGGNPVLNFKGSSIKTNTVAFKLPKWMRAYLRDSTGKQYPTTPLGYTELSLGQGDYLSMGGITTVNMKDADTKNNVSTSFPQLSFSQDGVEYALRWNDFAKERPISKGSYRQNWGYARAGRPVRGNASVYDMNLELDWNSIKKWWLIAAGVAALATGLLFWKR